MDASKKDALIARINEKLEGIDATQPTTLRNLYEGKIYPADKSYASVPGYKALAKKLSTASAAMQPLTAGSRELETAFEKYRAVSGDMAELIAQEQFAEGFALAVRMITESL